MAGKKKNGSAKPSTSKPAKTRGARKSRAESMTGAKEGAAEMRTAPSAELDLIEIDSNTFKFHLNAVKKATQVKDTATGSLRSANKAAKQVHENLPETIKEIIALERSPEPDKLKQRLRMLGFALKEVGSPVQINVYDVLQGDVKENAEKLGRAHATADQAMKSPYPKHSDLDALYEKGWLAVQTERAGGLAPKSDAAAPGPDDEDEGEELHDADDAAENEGEPVIPLTTNPPASELTH